MKHVDFITIRNLLMLFTENRSNSSISPELKNVIEKAQSVIMDYFSKGCGAPENSLTGVIVYDPVTGKHDYIGCQEMHCTDGTYLQPSMVKSEREK